MRFFFFGFFGFWLNWIGYATIQRDSTGRQRRLGLFCFKGIFGPIFGMIRDGMGEEGGFRDGHMPHLLCLAPWAWKQGNGSTKTTLEYEVVIETKITTVRVFTYLGSCLGFWKWQGAT